MNQQLFKYLATSPDHFPYGKNQPDTLFLITGESGVGKTTYCQQLCDSAQMNGWRVGGLLSVPVIVDGQKVAIALVDLATREKRPLATLSQQTYPSQDDRVITGRWLFDPTAIIWGNEVLRRITAVDLLIIDELGPLEFEQEQGLQVAFDLIATAEYRMAAVVIRPSLLKQAQQRWPQAQPIPIAPQNAALPPQPSPSAINPVLSLREVTA